MSEPLGALLNLLFLVLVYLLLWQVLRAARRELYPAHRASGPSARLRPLGEGPAHPISGQVVLGRDPRCSVVLEDSFASARHASIEWGGGYWILRDLGSTNGTLLGGHPVDEARLKNGDVVQIGDTRFHFEC